MADNVTTQIESKTRVSRISTSAASIYRSYLMFAYMLKDFIYSLFFVPYIDLLPVLRRLSGAALPL